MDVYPHEAILKLCIYIDQIPSHAWNDSVLLVHVAIIYAESSSKQKTK